MKRTMAAAIAIGFIGAMTGSALADDPPDVTPEDVEKKMEAKKKPDGWTYGLKLGANFSFGHSSNVVGTMDGINIQLGALLDGFVRLVSGPHEWMAGLTFKHSQTKTPALDSFVKSADSFGVKTLYLYRIPSLQWMGPYVQAVFDTQVFNGYDTQATARTYRIKLKDGTDTTKEIGAQGRYQLTGAFEPFVLMETAGLFARPIEDKAISIEIKLGAGVQHIFSRDGFAVADDDTTDEIELKQLETSHSGGVELDVQFKGAISDPVTWNVGANAFLPFVSTADDGVGIDAMNNTFTAGLSVKLAKWASLDYVLSIKRIPAISEEWQIQNGLLLTAGFDIL